MGMFEYNDKLEENFTEGTIRWFYKKIAIQGSSLTENPRQGIALRKEQCREDFD